MTSDMQYHDPEHKFEKSFWGDCCNTFGEEQKQWEYAKRMELQHWGYAIDLQGKKILDIGGGPVSLLLKCFNLGQTCTVIDPIEYPSWTYERYNAHNIGKLNANGEDILDYYHIKNHFNEVWMYNVLQHCMDPKAIIEGAKYLAPIIRIFEWINFAPHPGHPQMLTREFLDKELGGIGAVECMNGNGCYGDAYYGVFHT